jgi:hypothetical protein
VSRSLATINSQIEACDKAIAELTIEKDMVCSNINMQKQRKRDLQAKRAENSANGRKMTDHAIVRYMERIMGVDISEFEEEALKCKEAKWVIKRGVITTVTRAKCD